MHMVCIPARSLLQHSMSSTPLRSAAPGLVLLPALPPGPRIRSLYMEWVVTGFPHRLRSQLPSPVFHPKHAFLQRAQANNTKGPGKDEDEGVDVGRHEGGPQNGNRSPPPLLPPAPLRTSTPEPEGEEVQPMDHYYKINYDILGLA